MKRKLTETITEGFPCQYNCGRILTSQQNREEHHRRHVGDRAYGCKKCPANFIDRKALKTHFIAKHTGIRFTCPGVGCSHQTVTKQTMEIHIRSHHRDIDLTRVVLQRNGNVPPLQTICGTTPQRRRRVESMSPPEEKEMDSAVEPAPQRRKSDFMGEKVVHQEREEDENVLSMSTEKQRSHRKKRPSDERLNVAADQHYRCNCCTEELPKAFEIDHITPLWAGGSEEEENLQAVCGNCHTEKSRRERVVRNSINRIVRTMRPGLTSEAYTRFTRNIGHMICTLNFSQL